MSIDGNTLNVKLLYVRPREPPLIENLICPAIELYEHHDVLTYLSRALHSAVETARRFAISPSLFECLTIRSRPLFELHQGHCFFCRTNTMSLILNESSQRSSNVQHGS